MLLKYLSTTLRYLNLYLLTGWGRGGNAAQAHPWPAFSDGMVPEHSAFLSYVFGNEQYGIWKQHVSPIWSHANTEQCSVVIVNSIGGLILFDRTNFLVKKWQLALGDILVRLCFLSVVLVDMCFFSPQYACKSSPVKGFSQPFLYFWVCSDTTSWLARQLAFLVSEGLTRTSN